MQKRLASKLSRRDQRTSLRELFLFRRLITCSRCRRHLIGERHKTYLYYRCHTPLCKQITVRSELIDAAFAEVLETFCFTSKQVEYFESYILEQFNHLKSNVESQRKNLRTDLSEIQSKLLNITDHLISGLIDKRLFIITKNDLLQKELSIQEQLNNIETDEQTALQELESAFHFAQTASVDFEQGNYNRKRYIISRIATDILITDKVMKVVWRSSFKFLLQLKSQHPDGASN